MKVFLDANVIISVLNKEYPLFTYSARILSLDCKNHFEDLYLSAMFGNSILFFIKKKRRNESQTKDKYPDGTY